MKAERVIPLLLLIMLAVLGACAGYRPARFADDSAIAYIRDDAPIPLPSPRRLSELEYLSNTYLRTPIAGALDVTRVPEAGDINAADEVPVSSWFGGWDAAAVRLSHDIDGPPEPPFRTVIGATLTSDDGLRIFDARGLPYELFRDPRELPESSTAAAAVAARLVRMLGYRTPETWVIGVERGDFVEGRRRIDDDETIEAFLEDGPAPEGTAYRVAATRWPPGLDVGYTDAFGTRSDDPNDGIRHEERRTLRALRVVGAWIDLPQLRPNNTRDVYAGRVGRGHLLHYFVGFEDTLGAARLSGHRPLRAAAGEVRGGMFQNLVTLGLVEPDDVATRPGKTLAVLDPIVDLGAYAPPYDPARRMRADDAYWIAKRLARVRLNDIRWAVQFGNIGSAWVRRELVASIDARRLSLVAHAVSQVTPLEIKALTRSELVLSDEALRWDVHDPSSTRYLVEFVDDSGDTLTSERHFGPRGAAVHVPLAPELVDGRSYLVVRAHVERDGVVSPRAFEAHLRRRKDSGEWRVVGLVH